MKPRTFLLAAALVGMCLTVPARAAEPAATGGAVSALPPGFDGHQPQLAADAWDHALYLVVGQPKGDVYCARSSDGGATFAAPVKVANLPGLALGLRRGPRVAAVGGHVTVTAIDFQSGELLAFRSADRGQTWAAGVCVNPGVGDSAREGLQSLAVRFGDGLLYATWLDQRGSGAEIYGASSADHGLTWSANQAVYRSPDGHVCECCHPSASFDADGKLAVMWRNWLGGSRDLYVAVSTDGGRTFGPPAKQGAGTWKLSACPMDGGAVVPLDGGGFASVWQRDKSIYYAENREEALPENRLAAGTQPVAILAADRTVRVVWQEQDGTLKTVVAFAGQSRTGSVHPGPEKLAGPGCAFASLVPSPVPGGIMTVAWEAPSADGGKQVFVRSLP